MLCNQSSRFYCDSMEVEGLVKLLAEAAEAADDAKRSAYEGAAMTLEILSGHQLRYPRDFMLAFNARMFGEHESKTENERKGVDE